MTMIEVSLMHFTPNNLSSSLSLYIKYFPTPKPIKPNISNPHTQ